MNFTLSTDNEAMRDAAAAFLDREVDLAPLLRPRSGPLAVDRGRLWRAAAELGWAGLAIDERHGGLGTTLLDTALVLGETGRTLAPMPLLGTLAGSWAIAATADEADQAALLPEVAAGRRRLALCMADATGRCDAGAPVDAVPHADMYRLSGTAHYCVDAAEADMLLVAARFDGVVSLFAVNKAEATVVDDDWRDHSRRVATVTLEAAEGRLLGDWNRAWPAVRDRLYVALAAESAAVARASLAAMVDYAKERHAFGRPIGQYQAIKHQLAEVAGQVELADVGVQYAAWALDSAQDGAGIAAAIAQSHASETARAATYRNIQLFGAVGFTWEMSNHLFYKRARCNAALLGDPARQRDEVLNALQAAA